MATISKIRICNMALSNIGARSTIESFTEGTAEASECDLWYDYSRLQSLELHDWSFSRKRLTLATHSIAPPSGIWTYRYQYPSDSILLRSIQQSAGDTADGVPFEIEIASDNTKSILTDEDNAIGIYTFDQEDVSLFSPFFVNMLSFALAANIAVALTGKNSIRKEMVGTFSSLQRAAPAINSNEQMKKPPREAEWVRGR